MKEKSVEIEFFFFFIFISLCFKEIWLEFRYAKQIELSYAITTEKKMELFIFS